MIAISACLVGKNTKYDGKNNYNEYVMEYLKNKDYIVICPEVLGGLSTPRDPSEQLKDKVFSNKGEDVTNEFVLGANIALKEIIDNNVDEVILKERSPSCGKGFVYDGTFSHNVIEGNGVFVNTLLKHKPDIKILTESDIKEIIINNK